MDFPQYDFNNLNETDIREEILAPLLRYLGYRSGTANNIIREQPLSYPQNFLGRKKKSDPILRGRADYICDVQNQVRWVIEAKAPGAPLDNDAEEQSWSYANHPEIRAVYFCLSNGKKFQIFQTNRGPEAEPIFQCRYEEMKDSLNIIQNILSPESVIRDYPKYKVDHGAPIGPGLRSIVRITNGSIIYDHNNIGLKPFIGLVMSITEGAVERNENGKLEAYIETQVPYQSLQQLNEKLGLHSLHLFSDDGSISISPESPTIFSATTNHILPKGSLVLDLSTWRELPLPMNISVQAQTKATGYLDGNKYMGQFNALLTYQEFGLNVEMDGSFNVHIA
ncbi:MAG: type I restriction enzyme HsdR N-terminal domain-containing protein [Desulfobacteraceae bacterium]|nr:type I restriction enzyme HsdR N-terminal domain-containing protein [Desulfobacteraceae bacterium]